MVDGLEKVYGDRMQFRQVDWSTPEAKKAIRKYQLGNHGMVLVDADGKALWSEPDHFQKRETVEAEIRKALGGR